jgi:hypothetical protein
MTRATVLATVVALSPFVAQVPAAPRPKAGPVITAANVNRIRHVAEVEKAGVETFRPGPGADEVTLIVRRTGLETVTAATLRPVRAVEDTRPRDFAATRDGTAFAWLDGDGRVHVRGTAGGKPVAFHAGKYVCGLAWSPDGKLLAVGDTVNTNPKVEGSGDTRVRLWDPTGQVVRELPATRLGFKHPAFSPDGRLLAVGCVNELTRVYEVATGKLLHSLPRRLATQTNDIAIHPDGQVLATAHYDGAIELWELASGRHLRTVNTGRPVWSVAWSRKGDLLATAGSDRVVLWDPERLVEVHEVKSPMKEATWARAGFSGNGRHLIHLAVGGHGERASAKVVVWGLPDGD